MKRALIVDDIKENLYLLESLLKAYNFTTVTANNGAEALGLALKEPPDIIIADILMPVMDGYTLCREWKKEKVLKNIPFVFYTATYTHPKDGEFALSLGADKFIIKPQEPDDFMAIIEQVLSEFQINKPTARQPSEISEITILKEYNETLIRKMEDRMLKSEEAEKKVRIYASQLELEIEQRKQAEQEIIKALEHAKESDRLKSAFLANMSHEIRTPMNGILGFAELLKEHDLTGEQQQDYIRIIEKSGTRMLNIINDIVDISKIESGQMEVSITEMNVNEQIEYLYVLFKLEAERKRLEFSFKNNLPAKEAIIITDREKFFAILSNLVKNAIKYTDSGSIEFGCSSLRPAQGEASSPSGQVELEFFVKDTGIGIPIDRQEAIFDRFIQAETKDIQARQGAGLGLSIAKAYAEMLGGKIWVESEPGVGSAFYFTVPSYAAPEEKTVMKNVFSSDDKETQIKNLKVLITEDDEGSSAFLTIVLGKISTQVLKVRTGIEAVEVCRNDPDIKLVLMDILMPEMNGYEATQQIRQFNTDVVIIAQTAYALDGDREKAIEAGCNDYITKPIKIDKLLFMIKEQLKLS